ncbi:MAG: DUF1648 domain-containing protein [Acidimicrobiia bacterium]|nr:DUF1648 domain-containing protein [Acidimicrobiia bacterium]NNF63346.1 DUF1648 domain-containing protein [Acidimicrobiia bacterium]
MRTRALGTIVLPLISILAIVAFFVVVADRLPDQVATHWNGDGVADGFTSPGDLAIVVGGITLLSGGLMAVLANVAAKNAVAGGRAINGAPLSLVWFIGALAISSTVVQIDTQVVPSLPAASIPLALGLGAFGWFIGVWASGPLAEVPKATGPAPRHADRVPLDEGHTAVWSGRTPRSRALAVVLGSQLVIAVAMGLLLSWWAALAMVPVALLIAASMNYSVTLGPAGIRVAGLGLGLPRVIVPLDEISSASPGTVEAMSFGGWGIRIAGETAVITRSGPALVVTRTDGAVLRVSMDNPEEPAAVMATLMDRRS